MRVPFQLAAITVALMTLSACDTRSLTSSDVASEEVCSMLWSTFKRHMNEARGSEGVDKIYHAQIADMNLRILLHRSCCRFADSCPLYISE